MPFLFPNKLLTEGMRSAVTCQILEGNLPINFIWKKNGVSLVSQQTTTNNDVMNLIKNNVVRYVHFWGEDTLSPHYKGYQLEGSVVKLLAKIRVSDNT